MKNLLMILGLAALVGCSTYTAPNCIVLHPITCNSGKVTYTIRACGTPGVSVIGNTAFESMIESNISVSNSACTLGE